MEGAFIVRNWVAMLIKGVLGLAFGIVLLVWPRDTIGAIVTIFGIFALLLGLIAAVAFIMEITHKEKWGLSLSMALIFIFLGVLAMARTELTVVVFMFFVVAWLLAAGAIEMALGTAMDKEFKGRWLLIIEGILSIGVGLCLMLFTGPTLKLIVFFFGIYIIVMGLIDIVLSFLVRKEFAGGGAVVVVED
jgi:uncharacterized membrane protein HdeD (DUF308 family)